MKPPTETDSLCSVFFTATIKFEYKLEISCTIDLQIIIWPRKAMESKLINYAILYVKIDQFRTCDEKK